MMDLLITTIIICTAVIYPVNTANILVVFYNRAFSHNFVFIPLFQELASKGHNITYISSYPIQNPNITNISTKESIPIVQNTINVTHVQSINAFHESMKIMWDFYKKGIKYDALFTVDDVNILLNGPSKYDLLIAEHFNSELSLVFASKFNIPYILLSSCSLLPWNQQVFGQSYALATSPVTLTGLSPKMNFYDRIKNTISNAEQVIGYNFLCRKRDEEIIKKKLKIDVSLDQLVKNASLLMVNTHFTMFGSRAYVPAIVEVGGIHIQPIKPLPTDIQTFIDEAEHGVVYFCMGSLLRGETFPVEKRKMFLKVFEKIPQRVLWKWEGELHDKPSNVMIRKWMPQRDILAHPNVKLFISHGGLLGTTEAVYEGVPILSIPIFGDQMTNVKAVRDKGAAEIMYYTDLNEDEIFTKINSMLTDPTYKQKAKELSEVFRDRPMSPLETAVYWTEYVIRHKGAPHLRSAAVGMPWYQYYLIDVLLVIFISIATIFVSLYYLIFKQILRLIYKKSKEKQT